ncbi:MAG: glycosyltransferase family 4 protein [Gammaproteobacteria bacterium]|nr:glycosyltransferase family 4 protein [Gammaproteobacteria bacterium]
MSRIAHLTSAHPRDDTRIFFKQCSSLTRHGHDVVLIVSDGAGDTVRDGVRIVDVGRSSGGRLSRMVRTTQRVFDAAMQIDADVYHLHDPELLPHGVLLKRRGKRVVFDAHEDVPLQILAKHYLRPALRKTIARVFSRFERFACTRFDGVIAATDQIEHKFSEFGIPTATVRNFPIADELFSAPCDRPTHRDICYVGSIAGIRGIREMVRALELTHQPIRLNLVGEFSESDTAAEVSSYPGWERVNRLGLQDRAGVREALSRSFAGLVTLHPTPNYLESLPIKLFEYMSAELPVIVSDFPLWRHMLEDANCALFVDPLSPKAIAQAIDILIADPKMAVQMGRNGRRVIETRFNWEQEELVLLDFYRRIAPAQPLARA